MTTSPSIAEARVKELVRVLTLARTAHGDSATADLLAECSSVIQEQADQLRALLAETRGDEGFSSLGANAPSSGTEQSREPAGDMVERVARAVHAHRFDGTEVWDGDDCECEQVKAEFRYEAAEHLDALFGGRAFIEYVLAQDALSPAVEGPKT